jgi:hypothetical protein
VVRRELVEPDTAAVLVSMKDAKRGVKAALRMSKALWKDFGSAKWRHWA